MHRTDIVLDLIWADWAGCDTGGQPWRGERLVEEAENLVTGVDDPLQHAAVASMRGFTERHYGRMAGAFDHITRAIELFGSTAPTQEAAFYLNGYLTSLGFRHWAGALVHGLERNAIERDYLAQDLPFARMVFALFGSAACLAAGDEAGLRSFCDRMHDADPETVLSFWSSSAELYSAVSLLQRGEVTSGLQLVAAGTEHMAQAGARTMLAGIYAGASTALTRTGELDEARRMLGLARGARRFHRAVLPAVRGARGRLAGGRGG